MCQCFKESYHLPLQDKCILGSNVNLLILRILYFQCLLLPNEIKEKLFLKTYY